MVRKAGIITIPVDVLGQILFGKGTFIRDIRIDLQNFYSYGEVEFLVSGDKMPEVPEGQKVPKVEVTMVKDENGMIQIDSVVELEEPLYARSTKREVKTFGSK